MTKIILILSPILLIGCHKPKPYLLCGTNNECVVINPQNGELHIPTKGADGIKGE